MKRVLKWVFFTFVTIAFLVFIVGFAFISLSPQFGGKVSDEQMITYAKTGHYSEGIFTNPEEIKMEMNCHSVQTMVKEMLNPNPRLVPKRNVEVVKMDPNEVGNIPDTATRITWLGHSSFLIETAGKQILLDPVFGKYAAPHPLLGRIRFNRENPISIADLDKVDAVIISHDHYDHLDYPSIKELKDKVKHFFVPLGVGNHLRRWEIAEDRISEMDWWEEVPFENLNIILTPSRHMSGRGLSDQSSTLWGSWIIQNEYANVFFSGDGGYGRHFKEIGEKYGPFDIGLMECGQYNKLWRNVHMMPEESAVAAVDLGAEFIIPIHWASFALATHSWTDPIERITKAAKQVNIPIATPRIGESIFLQKSSDLPHEDWWLSDLN